MKIVVIGLGNPILGDDGVGWQVAQAAEKRLAESGGQNGVEVDCLSLGGLRLMERMIGYDHAIIVDAIMTGRQAAGSVTVFPLATLPDPAQGHTSSSHDTSLQTALDLGRRMGAKLPENPWVVAIQSKRVFDFSDRLSPTVARAVPDATDRVMDLLLFIQGGSHDFS